MFKGVKVGCAIPARLASTRFPEKILADFGGKPLLQHVFERAAALSLWDELVVLVDDLKTLELCKKIGAKAVMTPVECDNGTERLAFYLNNRFFLSDGGACKKGFADQTKMQNTFSDIDVWVLWQADEPLINEEMIHTLLSTIDHPEQSVWTLRKEIKNREDFQNPHVVKVVTDLHHRALYFSRAPIPYVRDEPSAQKGFKHIGLYAYRHRFLEIYSTMSPCDLESMEKLEQLRYMAHGQPITVHLTKHDPVGVNVPQDLSVALEACSFSSLFV